jgi:hypothetical protein
MNNKLIGILIVLLYFANYHICELIYPNDIPMFWKLKVAIYCLIILLAVEYKKLDNFIEKVFLAVVFNNIYVLLFKNEYDYTINDIYFILFFTAIQYVKQLYRNYSEYIFRNLAIYFNIKKPK